MRVGAVCREPRQHCLDDRALALGARLQEGVGGRVHRHAAEADRRRAAHGHGLAGAAAPPGQAAEVVFVGEGGEGFAFREAGLGRLVGGEQEVNACVVAGDLDVRTLAEGGQGCA